MLREPRAMPRLPGSGQRQPGERGQILVLFTLVIVVLMVLASLVIDAGLYRTDKARLQNALDAAALAAVQSMPASSSNVGAVRSTAISYTQDNYPGIAAPTVRFVCIVGVDSTGLPRVADMPGVCNVSLAASSPEWRCTDSKCWARCDPSTTATDSCNTVVVEDSATRDYYFGRAVGINSANTGTLNAAACVGPCGLPPMAPVDAVVILDRTQSMDNSNSVGNLRNGGRAVLQAFNPELQRVALGFTGPTSPYRVTGGEYGTNPTSQPTNTCTVPNTVNALALEPGRRPAPTYLEAAPISPVPASASTSVSLPRPAGTTSGNLLLAGITFSGGSNITVTPPSGWTLVQRTNSGTSVGVATYRRFAGASEPASYQWSLSASARASGGIVLLTDVDPTTPIDASGGTGAGFTSTTVTAPSVTTNGGNGAGSTTLVGFFASNSNATFTPASASRMTEQVDVSNGNASGPAIMIATGLQVPTGATGTKVATANKSALWAAQLVAVRGLPTKVDTYRWNIAADMGQWIPIRFTGTDTDNPPVTHREAYVDSDGIPVAGTRIVQAIGCFDGSSTGTNLARPLYMAIEYLRVHGRPGVKQGIILETDGAPYYANYGPSSDFTSTGVLAAAQAVKNAKIELFTVGYGVDSTTVTLLGNMASSKYGTTACTAAENSDGDHFFCQPTGGDLSAVLRAAAEQLVGASRLVQLYPQPMVTAVGPSGGAAAGGTSVTITGSYFDEAHSVTFGGARASSFRVVSDTTIVAVSPPGAAGTTVDIQVSTPGGSSKIVSADRYTYGP